MAQLQIVQQVNRSMECSACGAAGIAACDCGAPYMPAAERAAKAIAANPGKSSRALSVETGISEATLRRASTASNDAVEALRRVASLIPVSTESALADFPGLAAIALAARAEAGM